jgi:mannosyltransferase
VRYYRLSEAPIWVDEIFSWAVAHLRPSVLISYLYRGNNPPLWELLLSGWLRLTLDDSPFGLRFLPATFSALTAVGLYYLGRETGGISAGILAALLWVFSSFGQGVCREARAYGLLAFLSAISFLFFARYLKTQKSSYFWAWLVASIFIMHTHYSGFFVPTFSDVMVGALLSAKSPSRSHSVWSLVGIEFRAGGTGFCGSGFQLPCYGACFSLLTGEPL